MAASLSLLATMQVCVSGRWRLEAACKSSPVIDLCVEKAFAQSCGARMGGLSSVEEVMGLSRCSRGNVCKERQCTSSVWVQWLRSDISVLQLHILGLSLWLLIWKAFLIGVLFWGMKRIFSTYTTEHVCMARRFFGVAGLSFYTFVHSMGVGVAVGAGEGTGRGKGYGLMSMQSHHGHGLYMYDGEHV